MHPLTSRFLWSGNFFGLKFLSVKSILVIIFEISLYPNNINHKFQLLIVKCHYVYFIAYFNGISMPFGIFISNFQTVYSKIVNGILDIQKTTKTEKKSRKKAKYKLSMKTKLSIKTINKINVILNQSIIIRFANNVRCTLSKLRSWLSRH